MMGLAELERELAQFTYWPRWGFRPYLDTHLGPMLWIITTQPDREDPARTIDLGIRVRIPPHAMETPDALGRWLLWRIEEAAIHEVREGLRYRGKLVDDPHAAG